MNTSKDMKNNANTVPVASTVAQARRVELQNNRTDSRDLFVNTREIVIAHGDEIYRLRLTAQNKLILTK